MIEDIRRNIDTEIGMLREIALYSKRIEYADAVERRLLIETINALREAMKIINYSIPKLLNEVSLTKKLPFKTEQKKQELAKISYRLGETEFKAVIPRKDRKRLLKELDISESYIKKLRKNKIRFEEEKIEFKAARGYLKLANKLFLDRAIYWINKGHFKKLSKELQRANIDVLFQGYVAMIFMTAFLSFFIGIFISIVLFFVLSASVLIKITIGVLIPVVLPPVVFGFLYYYPTTEKKTIEKKINSELPFAVIHMSAISGSGIRPSEIFRIIGLSKEYPYLRKEIRKVLNQINLYGYDLVTALNNSSSTTPSGKLAELFSGLSTTITSGGDLSNFFEKRSETLLAEYRLTRERYIKTAETFMDIYISVVIAAPMILMLLFVMLSIGDFGLGLGLTIGQLTFFVITILTLINTVFLTFLHLNQPTY